MLDNINDNSSSRFYTPKREVDFIVDSRSEADYAMNKIKQAIIARRINPNIPLFTSEILTKAPSDFFAKYDDMASKTIPDIQTHLSNTDKSKLISTVQKEPTDTDLRVTAVDVISAAIETRFAKFPAEMRSFSEVDKYILSEIVINEIIGMGPIDPLWRDNSITEIICNGPFDVQIEKHGQLFRVPACRFRSAEHLQNLISRLYAAVDRDVTPTAPCQKARLRDNSRMMAVHRQVAPSGPNFNIRKHNEEFWTPDSLIKQDTANEEMMAYLGNLINAGASFLVIGGTGTGKTTTLNSLTGFFASNMRIVTIEDSLEMKPHPNKLFAAAMECVPAKPGAINERGITQRDLVKAALQMRPDGIIVGEVLDEAAYDLCQALNTGHWGASSLHANSTEEAMEKLKSLVSQGAVIKGEACYSLIASAFDIVIGIKRFGLDGSRKITEISEVAHRSILGESGQAYLPVKSLWQYQPDSMDNVSKVTGTWRQTGELSEFRRYKLGLHLKSAKTWDELKEISTI